MSFHVVQEGCSHKPPGPYWTGEHWAQQFDQRRQYGTLDEGVEAACAARATAVKTVLVMEGGTVLSRHKVRRSYCTQR